MIHVRAICGGPVVTEGSVAERHSKEDLAYLVALQLSGYQPFRKNVCEVDLYVVA